MEKEDNKLTRRLQIMINNIQGITIIYSRSRRFKLAIIWNNKFAKKMHSLIYKLIQKDQKSLPIRVLQIFNLHFYPHQWKEAQVHNCLQHTYQITTINCHKLHLSINSLHLSSRINNQSNWVPHNLQRYFTFLLNSLLNNLRIFHFLKRNTFNLLVISSSLNTQIININNTSLFLLSNHLKIPNCLTSLLKHKYIKINSF